MFYFPADIDAKSNGEEQSAIHYAAKFNAVQALKVLIDWNANVNDRDYKRRTPLFLAAETGKLSQILLTPSLKGVAFLPLIGSPFYSFIHWFVYSLYT